MNRPNRISLAIFLVTIGCAPIWVGLALWVIPKVIESGWRGESLGILNAFLTGRAEHPLEEYLAYWRLLWPGLLLDLLAVSALAALLARPETWAVARHAFGSTPSDAVHAAPKLAIGVVLLSLAVSEWYPFSQFAMYSTFASEGGYVLLTDESEEPIAASF